MQAVARVICRLTVLVGIALCALSPALAFAATPSVIATDGASVWSYQDAHDATAKRQGGYAGFLPGTTRYATDGASYSQGGGAIDQSAYAGMGPHGGYDTSTNKCKVCHAVHRAEGTYYLLRASSSDDACSYCHIGGSAHSDTEVYYRNPAGIYTPNGHTMGASAAIPDSTVRMDSVDLLLSAADGSITVKVRSYVPAEKTLYRVMGYGRSPVGHPAYSSGGLQFGRVGPTPLSCSSCHQVHAAIAQIWRPQRFDTSYAADAYGAVAGGYKLLRRFPGATIVPGNESLADTTAIAKVVETRLTADANYSTSASMETTYTEKGETFSQPDWVVGNGFTGGAAGPATAVNQFTLSVWCADCHNLNIGGKVEDDSTGVLFTVHSERTHPVPGAGYSATGGFQCYSCHRNDLSYGVACSMCHYSPSDYRADVEWLPVDSDFPHAGSDNSYKLLGDFSIELDPPAWVEGSPYILTYKSVGITEDNLDAVCQRCHAIQHLPMGALATHDLPPEYADCYVCHPSADAATLHSGTPSTCNACHIIGPLTVDCLTCHAANASPHGHDVPPAYAGCTSCHSAGDAVAIHAVTPSSCDACHGAGITPSLDCATCHPDQLVYHAYNPSRHLASVANSTVSGVLRRPNGTAYLFPNGSLMTYSGQTCGQCHSMDLLTEHTKPTSVSAGATCAACHPSPRNTFAGWNDTCQQSGCHATIHNEMTAKHVYPTSWIVSGCGGGDAECHNTADFSPDFAVVHNGAWYWGGEWGFPGYLTPYTNGCVFCHTSPTQVPAVPTRCTGCHYSDHLPVPQPW